MADTLFDLADFEETRVEWVPVWDPRIEDFGWKFAEAGSVLYDGDGSKVTPAQWKAYVDGQRCRDCGRKCEMNQGGGGNGHSFRVCDACAQLDACTTRQHDRGPEWHVSHWGESHPADEHEKLVAAQAKRRAAYLAKMAHTA